MSNMVLGGYTFAVQPSKMTLIEKDRSVAHVQTYSSVAFFSWGVDYDGKTIELFWASMPTSQYASLRAIYEADAQVVFDPQDGSSKTFNVQMLPMSGEYFIHLSNATGHRRLNVKIPLLIMSEV
ncbi:MAG: hypothetical protein WC374_04185 [Phycisphaerae bacterium]|jgi:hypothetical protein